MMVNDTERRPIFVAGTHGVGKSTLAKAVGDSLTLEVFSAGQLIREVRNNAKADKRVEDVAGNQDALLSAIRSRGLKGRQYVLDGHFCLMGEHAEIHFVPLDVLRELELGATILVYDEPDAIVERLKRRDNSDWPATVVGQLQAAEVQRASEVCTALKIPFRSFGPSQHEMAIDWLREINAA